VFVSFFPEKPEEEKVRQTRRRNGAPSAEDEAYADSTYVYHAEALRDHGYEPKPVRKASRTSR
jgi:hypothetical protein